MNTRYILGSLAALAAVLAIGVTAFAIGSSAGDDDDGSSASAIRTEKGLTAANADFFLGGVGGDEADDGETSAAPVPQAPEADVDTGVGVGVGSAGPGRGGDLAPFPQQAQVSGGTGITVQGYGTATADADSAQIDFYFGRYSDKPIPLPEPAEPPVEGDGSDGSTPSPGVAPDGGDDVQFPDATPITEEDLQPVIDALVAAGVAPDDIEFVEQGYYDPYWASATLRATVNNLDALDDIVDAGTNAANSLEGISLQSSNVMYSISDCAALEQAALEAAIEDAGDNVAVFAAALGVTAGDIVGATDYTYHSQDGDSCGSYWGYYPVAESGFVNGPTEVSVYAQVSITYAIQ
jgi:uncharacterized protein YggE